MNLDPFRRQAGHFCRGRESARQNLRSHPDLTAILPHLDGAVHRLHGRVREKRYLVYRFDLLCDVRQGLPSIAVAASDHPGFHAKPLPFGSRFRRC